MGLLGPWWAHPGEAEEAGVICEEPGQHLSRNVAPGGPWQWQDNNDHNDQTIIAGCYGAVAMCWVLLFPVLFSFCLLKKYFIF